LLIVAFCIGLGIYLFMARRKRLRNNPRDEWEFDLLEEDEADGLNGAGKATRGGKGGKRRGGELYDAFAAGSEDELSDGEFVDEAGQEKRLYDDEGSGSEEGSESGGLRSPSHHVIGELDSEDEEEVVAGGAKAEKR
jgi:kexin